MISTMQKPKSKNSQHKLKQVSLLRRLWLNSETKLWAKIQGLSAAVLGSLIPINSALQSTEFKNVLSTVTVPWYIPTGIAVFAFITYCAHGHGAD